MAPLHSSTMVWQKFVVILCLMVGGSISAFLDSSIKDLLNDAGLASHASRVARAANAKGYDIGTFWGAGLTSGSLRGLTKRDVEEHASHPSKDSRDFEFHLSSGELLSMSVRKRPVMDSDTAVVENFKNKKELVNTVIRDCIFSGVLTNERGHVSISLCDGQVVGAIHTKKRNYQLHPLPENVLRERRSANNSLPVLVTWSDRHDEAAAGDHKDPYAMQDFGFHYDDIPEHKTKRSLADRKATVEVGVYLDQLFLQRAEEYLNLTTAQELTELISLKWSGVSAVLSNTSLVQWDITIKIVHLEIWREDPPWYNDTLDSGIGARLESFCNGTQWAPFDHLSLETAYTGDSHLGVSYVGSACNPRYRCAACKGASYSHIVELHEFGHSLGLKHDVEMSECDTEETKGFMTANEMNFRPCYAEIFDRSFRGKSCLFVKNVNVSNYNPLEHVVPKLEGQILSHDGQCAFTQGDDFEYLPADQSTICSSFYCLSKARLGEVRKRVALGGTPCGTEKMCFGKCTDWVDSLNKDYLRPQVVEGQWGPWSEFSPCNNTCGEAVSVSTRKCNNPEPRLAAYCSGAPSKAQMCPPKPVCPGDSGSDSDVLQQRATAVCSAVRDSGTSPYNLTGSGNVYGTAGVVDKCTAKCNRYDGSPAGQYLLSDGTPCAGRDTKGGYDVTRGVLWRCVQGRCMAFGCDGKTSETGALAEVDACGVCGGNGTSCEHGVFEDSIPAGNRTGFVIIPAGSTNVLISMPEIARSAYDIELWTKDEPSQSVISKAQYKPYKTCCPTNFAGTQWYYLDSLAMSASGPLDQPVRISIYSVKAIELNTSITWRYTKGLAGVTNLVCANGGIPFYGGCKCNGKFFGVRCQHRCNVICENGATLNTSSCTCICNERQTGPKCGCKSPYGQENCSGCAERRACATNGGVQNLTSCRCDCPVNCMGDDCSAQCRDLIGDCARSQSCGVQAQNDRNCSLSCGYCRIDPSVNGGRCLMR